MSSHTSDVSRSILDQGHFVESSDGFVMTSCELICSCICLNFSLSLLIWESTYTLVKQTRGKGQMPRLTIKEKDKER